MLKLIKNVKLINRNKRIELNESSNQDELLQALEIQPNLLGVYIKKIKIKKDNGNTNESTERESGKIESSSLESGKDN
jgi:hypothetical protein